MQDDWYGPAIDEVEAAQSRRNAPYIKPFVWRDPRLIPPREFLYARHYIRKFVSTTFAHGGVGKSALLIAEALAMCSGRALLGVQPDRRYRVAYWNGEDPMEETERRVHAALMHYELGRADVEGWFFWGSGREEDLIIAEQTRDGATIIQPNVEHVIDMAMDFELDVQIIDPFVSCHRVTENDNMATDLVVKRWGKIADHTNTATELAHHLRKTNGVEATVEDGRGAISLLAGARSARVLNPMTREEAQEAGVENPRAYFRARNGKANLSPPSDKSDWFKFVSIDLGNTPPTKPDTVGAVTQWEWPDPMADIRVADLIAVQRKVQTQPYREDGQSNDWVGKAVAEVIGIDPDSVTGRPARDKAAKAKIGGMLKRWYASGALTTYTDKTPKGEEKKFVRVGTWVET